MSKRFINTTTEVVPDLMQGLSLDSARVTLLEPTTGHHIAVRASLAANTQTPRVSVVSGGGSGHEPMAGGYVGDGMLAAAVAGGLFASPSVASISAMLEVVATRSIGILVVVMNYQGDRLNFGLAVKDLLKKSPGYPIHLMVVADDVALPNVSEKRGIAGTVFVLKVAGAAADQGRPFQEVVNIAETAARSVVSYGVALEPCTIPGHPVDNERLSTNEIELGMGIHGEPGAETQLVSNLDRNNLTRDLVSTICTRLDRAMHTKSDLATRSTGLALMVNNLGAVSQAEMLIVTKAVANFIHEAEAGILNGNMHRIHLFVGSFMTSLQMTGISVSCLMLPADNGIMEQFLHARTECSAWSTGFELFPPSRRTVVPILETAEQRGQSSVNTAPAPVANIYFPTNAPLSSSQQQQQQQMHAYTSSQGTKPVTYTKPKSPQQFSSSVSKASTKGAPKVYAGAKAMSGAASTRTGLSPTTEMYILTITSSLQSHCDDLAKLDRKTGDGDLGDTVQRGCEQIRKDLSQGKYSHAANNPCELFHAIVESIKIMGGSSGAFTEVFLKGAADKFEQLQFELVEKGKWDGEKAWRSAFVNGTKAVMEHGKARVGHRTLVDALKPAADVFERGSGTVEDAAQAARVGYESTKSMTTAKFGRSAHVRSDKLLNQPDPGAFAVCLILESLVNVAP